MTGYLLDTTVIIDWLRDHSPTVAWLKARAEAGERLVFSPITVAELLSGVPPHLRAKRREQLAAYEFQPFTFEMACLAGEMYYDRERSGGTIPIPDLLQASMARVLKLRVATSNPDHFPGVAVENPREFDESRKGRGVASPADRL